LRRELCVCWPLRSSPPRFTAHGKLRSSNPAKGEHLSVVPRQIRLVFSEAYESAYAHLEVTGPGGSVRLGELQQPADSPRVMLADVEGGLTAGIYTVKWQIAGADGHAVRGEYTFVIAPEAAGLSLLRAPGQAAPPASHHAASTLLDDNSFDAG
jgi:methionine-rich copper-binding protein CopC